MELAQVRVEVRVDVGRAAALEGFDGAGGDGRAQFRRVSLGLVQCEKNRPPACPAGICLSGGCTSRRRPMCSVLP